MSGYTFSTSLFKRNSDCEDSRREFDFLELAIRNLYKIETQPASTQYRHTCTCACVHIRTDSPCWRRSYDLRVLGKSTGVAAASRRMKGNKRPRRFAFALTPIHKVRPSLF